MMGDEETERDDIRQQIIDTVRRFVAREVIPVASQLEREDRFPVEIVEQMRELGLFCVPIPESYGGLGLDLLTYVGVIKRDGSRAGNRGYADPWGHLGKPRTFPWSATTATPRSWSSEKGRMRYTRW